MVKKEQFADAKNLRVVNMFHGRIFHNLEADICKCTHEIAFHERLTVSNKPVDVVDLTYESQNESTSKKRPLKQSSTQPLKKPATSPPIKDSATIRTPLSPTVVTARKSTQDTRIQLDSESMSSEIRDFFGKSYTLLEIIKDFPYKHVK